jgi:hypothetical protein
MLKFDKKELLSTNANGDCVHQSSDVCKAVQDPQDAAMVNLEIGNLCA